LLLHRIEPDIFSILCTFWPTSAFGQNSAIMAAIGPGLVLNGVLVAVLIIVDAWLPIGMRENSKAAYLIISALAGSLAYALAFLYLPLPALASEAQKWKRLLRLES
jgi:hypothetical protein